ncbi:MAG TPA: response regulator [Candidatus Tectomicrobia bacterium]|jgi:DNA-binding response OmpR family regulator
MACILIIDDDTQLRTALRESLEEEGYEVIEASDGFEGLQHYRTASIDVIILDMLMPRQEGVETITALRQKNPAVKIIAISGGGQTGRMDFLYVATVMGAQRTLRKPFRRQELLDAVRELMQCEDEGTRPTP